MTAGTADSGSSFWLGLSVALAAELAFLVVVWLALSVMGVF